MKVLVVSGTRTAVVKTVVTAAVEALAAARGEHVVGVKPDQPGAPADVDDVRCFSGVTDLHALARYPLPPATAARRARRPGLAPTMVAAAVERVLDRNLVLVEGQRPARALRRRRRHDRRRRGPARRARARRRPRRPGHARRDRPHLRGGARPRRNVPGRPGGGLAGPPRPRSGPRPRGRRVVRERSACRAAAGGNGPDGSRGAPRNGEGDHQPGGAV